MKKLNFNQIPKLKTFIASDIHSEFWTIEQSKNAFQTLKIDEDELKTADLILLAGDLGSPSFYLKKPSNLAKYLNVLEHFLSVGVPVVLIAGNHEFYYSSVEASYDFLLTLKEEKLNSVERYKNEKLETFRLECEENGLPFNPSDFNVSHKDEIYKNLYFLQNDLIEIEDKNIFIFGSTLWAGNLKDNKVKPFTTSEIIASTMMNDYRLCFYEQPNTKSDKDKNVLKPQQTLQEFEASLKSLVAANEYVKNKVKENATKDYVFIVMTHHLPSHELITNSDKPEFAKEDISRFYFSELSPFLTEHGIEPHYWIHGHFHYSKNIQQINQTIVISNTFGYLNTEKDTLKNEEYLENTETDEVIFKQKTNYSSSLRELPYFIHGIDENLFEQVKDFVQNKN